MTVVVHAAALKQVPACEYNPFEAIKTNVLGARNVIDAAIDAGGSRHFALCTDKAWTRSICTALPSSARKGVREANAYAGAEDAFAARASGNVVGSRGGVIPVFLEQRQLGKITITDPRMTRFWITLIRAWSS